MLLGISNIAFAQFKTSMPKPPEANLEASQKLNVTNIRKSGHIQVTNPHYDNIGQILTKIDFKYESYAPERKPYMIFINCGTSTPINPQDLTNYVENGGVLYASDLSDEVLQKAFPGVFQFEGRIGKTGEMQAIIEDSELKDILGSDMEVHFDLQKWAVLNDVNNGKVLMRAENGKPLMVEVEFGKGRIFYTCFHNHKQASSKEEALLKLLITKQVASIVNEPFADTAEQMGLNLQLMKIEFKD